MRISIEHGAAAWSQMTFLKVSGQLQERFPMISRLSPNNSIVDSP